MSDVIDRRWYKELAPLSIETLLYLKSNPHQLHEQKRKFLSGEIETPVFDYAHIDITEIQRKEAGLEELKNMLSDESNAIVRDLYLAKIDEYKTHAQLLRSSYTSCVSPAQGESVMKEFEQASEYLYGPVNPEIFNLTLRTLRKRLQKVSVEVQERHPHAYACLQRLVQDVPAAVSRFTFNLEKHKTPDTRVVTDLAEVVALFNAALREHGLSDTWSVEADTTGLLSTFSVVAHKRIVAIPGQRFFLEEHEGRTYTVARLRGIIAHEIHTHALRRYRGRRSKLRLLGAGLDRYDRGDEGLATYRAQKEKGVHSFAGFLGYLACGTALGMEVHGKKKNFAELYEVLHSYFLIIGRLEEQVAASRAWHVAWRIFRGTTCSIPGVIFLKDTLYREGNISMHQLLAEYPNIDSDMDIGNFDPTRASHVRSLCALGLLPADPWQKIASEFGTE